MENSSLKGIYFFSECDIKEMVLILRKKLVDIDWRLGDSDYEGFYVLGHSKDKVRVKITTEDEAGNYYLGIYFWKAHDSLNPKMRRTLQEKLQKEVLSALDVQINKYQK